MTDTELTLTAAAAIIGDSNNPKIGYSAAEPPRAYDPAQIAFHKGHRRAFHGHVGACPHGNPNLRLRERRR